MLGVLKKADNRAGNARGVSTAGWFVTPISSTLHTITISKAPRLAIPVVIGFTER